MNFKLVMIFLSLYLIQVMSEIPKLILNSKHQMPMIGVGSCWDGISKYESLHLVKDAIDIGYRHIDTAYICNNEVEVGLAVEEKILASNIKREDLFITAKLWNTFHSKSRAIEGINMALKKLGVKYIDLMLIHWPMGYSEGTVDIPRNGEDILFSSIDYLETWTALEDSVKEGLVKSIGVANFNHEQLKRLIDNSKIKPAVNQIESNPEITQKNLTDFCHQNGIAVTAYNPLGDRKLLDNPVLKKISDHHKMTVSQVMIKYQIQRKVSVIIDFSEKDKMKELLNISDFTLSSEDIIQIDGINIDKRSHTEDGARKHRYYPFNIPFLMKN